MSISASDIVIYGCANHAQDDISTQGGAIDTTIRLVMDSATLFNDPTASGGDGTLKAVSDNAGDTMNITVTGRTSSGSIVSETKALTGTTLITLTSNTFERLLKITLASSATGTITVSDSTGGASMGNTIVAIESSVTEVRRLFYDSSADASGGSSRDFYEKVFVKNTNGTNALLNAQIKEQADPGANITFDLEDAVDDNNSTASRLDTAPTGMLGSFDSADKSVPGTDLAAGSAIGVWLKMTLAAGASAAKNTYTLRAEGSTT